MLKTKATRPTTHKKGTRHHKRHLSTANTVSQALHNPSIAKHIPPPLKPHGSTTIKPDDLNTHHYENDLDLEEGDVYEQFKLDKRHKNESKTHKRAITLDAEDIGENDAFEFTNDSNIMNFEELSKTPVKTPNSMYKNLINVMLPPKTSLDEFSYMRIKKIASLNPDLLDMSETKLHQRLQQLSHIVLNPAFYNNYHSRHVYAKHNILPTPPAYSVMSGELSEYLVTKKEELSRGINNNNNDLEAQLKAHKKLHSYPYHPMVLHVFERFPLILRRKHIEETPEIIKNIFTTVHYDELEGEFDFDENFNKIDKNNDIGININPYELLGKYPALLSLDLTNKVQEKIDQFSSFLLQFLTKNDVNYNSADVRYTKQQIKQCNNYVFNIILQQPDILHANIASIIPKRLQFIHQTSLLSSPLATMDEIIMKFPRLLSPTLKPSQLQRISLLRLKPPRFDHITPSDLQGLGFEANFAEDMIKKLSYKLPTGYPMYRKGTNHLSIDEHNKMEDIYTNYNQCWAQLLGSSDEKVELIKMLTLMHTKTFSLLFHDFNAARKQANQSKQGARLARKFTTDENPSFAHERVMELSAAPLAEPEEPLDYHDLIIDEIEQMDVSKQNHSAMSAQLRSDDFGNSINQHFINGFDTTPATLSYEDDRASNFHPTPSRDVVQNANTKKNEKNINFDSKIATQLSPEDYHMFNKSETKVVQRDEARQREMRYKGKNHLQGDDELLVATNDPENIDFGTKLSRRQHPTIVHTMASNVPEDEEPLLKYAHSKKLQKFEKQKIQKQAIAEENHIRDEVEFYNNTPQRPKIEAAKEQGLHFYDDLELDELFSDVEESNSPNPSPAGNLDELTAAKQKKMKKLQKMHKQQASLYEKQWVGDSKYDRPNM